MSTSLTRQFEGRTRLDALLERAGSLADTESVAEAFLKAQREGVPVSVVISALFEDEPRFSSRDDAPSLYGNLFGLWDLLEAGAHVDLSAAPSKAARPPKPKPPSAPGKFPLEGPSAEWLERAFGYLEACSDKERTRLQHAFENRFDALVTELDESGAGDRVYAEARQILFELFALLELGAPLGLDSRAAAPAAGATLPQPLRAWAEEAVFQASTDDEEALEPHDAEELQRLVNAGVRALWQSVVHSPR